MRITSVEAIPIELRLSKPVIMADKVVERSLNTLVRISTDDGITGWGEAAEAPLMTGHTQEMIVAAIEGLATGLLGADPRDRARFWLEAQAEANSSALAALDIALADLEGRVLGLPVSHLLGGAVRAHAPALALFGSGNPDHDLPVAETLYQAGYRWFKMKLGIGKPEEEARTLRQLRARFGDTVVLAGDANTAWDPPAAVLSLQMLEHMGMAFIEQPVAAADVEGMDEVARSVEMPIGADEGVRDLSDVLRYASTAVAGVSLKLIKMGGLTGVIHAAIVARALGLKVNLGGKIAETSISSAAVAHASAAVPALDWGVSVTHDLIDQDVVLDPITLSSGRLAPPPGPGLGIEVDQRAVDRIRG